MYDLAVVGGGPVGWMTCALAQRAGLRGVLIDGAAAEIAPPQGELGLRVVALAPASRALFQGLGAWPEALSSRAGPYRRMEVWDARGGARINFDADELGLPDLGCIVEYTGLQWALQRADEAPRFERRVGVAVTGLDAAGDHRVLRLGDGAEIQARLVVGADGAESLIRRRAGIAVAVRDYGQRGVVASLDCERPHGQTARQAFTARGPLGLLPLADGRVSIVWSMAVDQAREILELDDEAFSAEVSEAAGHCLGAMQVRGARAAFDLRLLHAADYAAPRVALVGDAAHVVHPLAGLGLNLGLADASTLIDAIAPGHDCGDGVTLRRWARQRRADVQPAVGLIDSLERLFGHDGRDVRALRGVGLRLVAGAPLVKRQFMRYAVGGA